MALIEKKDGEWVFGAGKHQGKTLTEVAEESPGYLQWVHENVTKMPDDAFYALEDVMEEYDIEVL